MCALVSSYTAKENAPAIPSNHHVPRIECLVLVVTASTESSGVQWVAFLLPLPAPPSRCSLSHEGGWTRSSLDWAVTSHHSQHSDELGVFHKRYGPLQVTLLWPELRAALTYENSHIFLAENLTPSSPCSTITAVASPLGIMGFSAMGFWWGLQLLFEFLSGWQAVRLQGFGAMSK